MIKSGFGENRQPYAIVINLDSMNGLQTARILARHQVPVIAIAKDPRHYCCRTRVCEKILFADTSSDEFIETLETLGPSLSQKAVLFPCADMSVLSISRHRRRLEKWYHVVLPPPDVVETLMDKIRFGTYAQEKGLPIPRTFLLHDKGDIEQAIERLDFPCVLKPPNSAAPEWEKNCKLKAFRVFDADELYALYGRCKMWTNPLILQEWIEGSDVNHYTCNCYYDANSEPIVTFISRKIRQWPPHTGEGCLSVEARDDVVLRETLRFFSSVPYRGLGYLEMKRDERSGEYYIIEPNIGRPTGRSAIAEAGGVELLYTMYCDALGLPLPENRVQQYGGVKWVYLRRDFQSTLYHWRRGNLGLGEWWRSLRGRKAYALFSWTDPGPFLGDLWRAARLFTSAEERRKRDYDHPLS